MEVAVAPGLVAGIDVGAEGGACIGGGAVPVDGIGLEAVAGCQVEAAAEPPDRRRVGALGDEEPDVGVGDGHIRIAGMDDQRYAHRLPAASGEIRAPLGGCRGQRFAPDVGEADAGLLENRAVPEDPRASATAFLPLPGVLDEASATVLVLYPPAQPVLQREQVVPHGLRSH